MPVHTHPPSSSVATASLLSPAAAYQSGEKLSVRPPASEALPEKRGIVHNEILLPANAPPEYADRNTLWNAAEAVEKQWTPACKAVVLSIAQRHTARPVRPVWHFCNQQFVSKGMRAILPSMTRERKTLTSCHDRGRGQWMKHGNGFPRAARFMTLCRTGTDKTSVRQIRKSHKEDTVDWNDRKYCEIWRHEWKIIDNAIWKPTTAGRRFSFMKDRGLTSS